MLPSREQDYTQPYFRELFPKMTRLLHDATVLVIVGYSIPDEDALLRFVLNHFAENEEERRKKRVFYISPSAKPGQLRSVFPDAESLPDAESKFSYIIPSDFRSWVEQINTKINPETKKEEK